ncbi:MAG: lipopolysaccharide kinase InaA family protein [Candidatus Scalinduaceae bacterium]
MRKPKLPDYFSTLNNGKTTLYIKKEVEDNLPEQDINKFFNLFKNSNEEKTVYYGRSICKSLLLSSFKNESLVIRDYWHGGLLGKVSRNLLWQRLRPLRELSICEAARKNGILTTEIIAFVKNKVVGPIYKCKLVSKEITNAVDLMELLLHSNNNRLLSQKKQIISKVSKAIKDMHDAGIYHADLHLKNILIQPTDKGLFSVYIIDLDKSKQYEVISLHRRMKNIMRLDRSLEKFRKNISGREGLHESYQFPITKTDKVRFLREYVKSSYKPDRYFSGGKKEFLKFCFKNYRTPHKLHRFWWLVTSPLK